MGGSGERAPENVAKIALSAATFAIDRPYSYQIPKGQRVVPGQRVLVPFGAGNRTSEGIVLSLSREEKSGKLKEILTLLDETPVLGEKEIQLALWMRERFFCTAFAAVRAMLPTGMWYVLQQGYALAPGLDRERVWAETEHNSQARGLAERLYAWGGHARLEQIRAIPGLKNPGSLLRELKQAGILIPETGVKRKVGDKTEKIAALCMPAAEAMAKVTPRRKNAPLRYAVTELLCGLGSASVKELCYYTGASLQTLKSLEKSGILTLKEQEVFRHTVRPSPQPASPVVLNAQQQRALDGLSALTETGRPEAALLYGVTGSGKTQVYLKLIRNLLEQGKDAIVLVPEIALTPSLLQLFITQFGQQVAVLHSSLPTGERYDEWKRVREGRARVVVGTRSAVFAPVHNLGLIVLDEEQESSYQSESMVRYHAREVAKFRCTQHGALLLLSSATPAVESRYAAEEGSYHLFTLQKRYNDHALPQVRVIDMKQELRRGNDTGLSLALREELEENFRRGEQSILFLNRRGNSRMVSCSECGQVPTCPRCSVHLTYHSANGRLMCHYCGHSEPLPLLCPQCGGRLQFIGTGTQRIQEELKTLYPDTEVLRMDADTISATQSHEVLLERFRKKRIPILLGTQMVAKGLDFENVTLVGVIAADLSLYTDSYRAAERTFSLLTQVVGRSGRGEKPGRAVIQTWTPDNDVIGLAARQDYDAFYQGEREIRRIRRFPPFTDLMRVTASGPEESLVLRACSLLRESLRSWQRESADRGEPVEILGPAPAVILKVNNRYRYHIVLKCRNDKETRAMLAQLLRTAQSDRMNRGISIWMEVNPMD